jgi:hypothetical protein
MKALVGLILAMIISFSTFANSRDSVRRLEKQKTKIERKRQRIMHQWDERTLRQKQTDRRVLIFLAISAGILANSISHKE